MKKLITFVFLFSFFAAGIILTPNVSYAQTQGQASSQNQAALQAEFNAKMSQIDGMSGAQADNAYHALINDAKYTSIIQANPTMYSGSSLQNYDYSKANVSDATKEKLAGITNLNEEDANGNKVHGALIDELIAKGEYDAVRDAERAQVDMRKNGTTQEEAEKFVVEDREKKRQELAEAQAKANCNKGGSNFTKYLLSYVGSGGGNFCWFCPMFEGLFDAMNNLATAISVKMADIFLMIMGVGLLFSIAFKVAKMVTSLQGADLMQFLTDMFKHLGRAIIATALLVSSLSIFTYLVSPILTMSMGVSAVIMDEGGGRGAVVKATQATGISAGSICDDLADQMKVSTSVEDQEKAFTPEVRASFICALRTMSAGLIFGIILGVCIYALTFSNLIHGIFPNVQYAILGVIIVLGHLAILITFPFKLIDSMIRMAFVTALMPLWIILWVFPATVGYTKKAWDLFLSSCLIFVCLSVVITLVMTIMQYAIPNREEIIGLLTCGFDKEAADKIPIGGRELLVTAALTFLGWKMLGTATTLASSFVGAIPDLGIGQSINETTVKGAKLVGKGGRALGRKAANSKAGQWVQQKTGLDSRRAAKLGTLAAAGVATAGVAPVLYGIGKGGMAGYRAVRNKFMGGGDGAVQENNKAPNTPPQGNEKVPNVPPQGNEKAPNTPPQGDKKAPNVPPQGNMPNPPMPTPNIPSPKGKTAPANSWSSGSGTPSEAMSFSMGGQSAGGMPVTSGTSSIGTGKSTETMSFNAGESAGGTATSTSTSMSFGGGTSSETMSFTAETPTTGSTPATSISASSGTEMSPEPVTYTMGTPDTGNTSDAADSTPSSFDAAPSQEPLNKPENADRADSPRDVTDNRKDNATDQVARDAARQAAADAQRAAAQAAAAQAAAAQAMSEASKKDKDDDKKNKPE